MKLFLVSREDEGGGYDSYKCFVVCSSDALTAAGYHPGGIWGKRETIDQYFAREGYEGGWVENSSYVSAEEIGIASENLVEGQIMITDYHAG